VPATVDVRPVRRARRTQAGPARRRDRRERRGRESDQDQKSRREEREEDYHLKSGKGKALKRGSGCPPTNTLIQRGSGNRRRRQWRRRPTIFCIGYVATDAMATGCSRRCRRRRRRASLPMKDMRLARYHSLAAAAPPSDQGRRPPLVGRSDGLGTKSRKENGQASFGFRPLDRPRPRRFRLRLLDRRRARWRRATRSTNRRRSGSLPGAIVPERTLAYYVELFLVSLSTTPYYTTDEEYYIFVIHPYTTLFWVRRRS